MTLNPHPTAALRWFKIVIGVVGVAVCVALVWRTLSAGATEGCFTRNCVSDKNWTAQDHPTQFWFYVLFWAAIAGIFGRMTWKAWRG